MINWIKNYINTAIQDKLDEFVSRLDFIEKTQNKHFDYIMGKKITISSDYLGLYPDSIEFNANLAFPRFAKIQWKYAPSKIFAHIPSDGKILWNNGKRIGVFKWHKENNSVEQDIRSIKDDVALKSSAPMKTNIVKPKPIKKVSNEKQSQKRRRPIIS